MLSCSAEFIAQDVTLQSSCPLSLSLSLSLLSIGHFSMLFFAFFLVQGCSNGVANRRPTENVLESYLLGKSTDQLPPERLFINNKKKKTQTMKSLKASRSSPEDLHLS